ncbi:MAG TPA: D-cysteine desulfhydrase family protein [Vicinamibacterales bacterium]|nr:D-cysteine desulfhydrase family protein [Vicinamibacterales bacterium]
MTPSALREAIGRFPSLPLVAVPTLVEPLPRLREALGGGPRLLIKRDDAIAFGFGGNKVRKLALVAAHAQADGADTLITAGGVQSNHARATAAAAARLGMRAVLVANGSAPEPPTANALLDRLLGAEIVYVDSRDQRAPKMDEVASRLRREGRRPFTIPVGASTPLGALGYVLAVAELVEQIPPPDVVIHATSSGGTQAGLVAGCQLLGLPTRVVGISADESAAALESTIATIVGGVGDLIGGPSAVARGRQLSDDAIKVDDSFVGEGYGFPTAASREAIDLAARCEAIFLDPTYTAKAMAGLIASVRDGRFTESETVLFWHTGGQVGLFA